MLFTFVFQARYAENFVDKEQLNRIKLDLEAKVSGSIPFVGIYCMFAIIEEIVFTHVTARNFRHKSAVCNLTKCLEIVGWHPL